MSTLGVHIPQIEKPIESVNMYNIPYIKICNFLM